MAEGGALALTIVENDASYFTEFGTWSTVCLDLKCHTSDSWREQRRDALMATFFQRHPEEGR